jgi:dihydrofolate synthase/folylpolyglutamate synthase
MPRGIRFASLREWLEWQQTLHPRAIELGLERVSRVLSRTGWRPPVEPVVTIGGTNGKGSCVAFVDGMARAGGYRVATFTSPHLVDYRERVCIDGRMASEATLVAAFERIADALGEDSLTFFEFNTLAALLAFETAAPDLIVLEVGMGGRLDSVNVIDADVAVVTSVGLDHVEWLGPDVESIAREKAGIFRQNRPAICGAVPVPDAILERARDVGARLLLRERDYDGIERADGKWDYRDSRGALEGLPVPALPGPVQVANAAMALAALRALCGRLPVDRDAIEQGLRTVRLPGRFERISSDAGFEWVLDVAHNPDSARVLAGNLARYPVPGRTIAVCGMLADKDVEGVAHMLRDRVDRWIAAGTDGARGLSDADLAARVRRAGIEIVVGGSVAAAMERASRVARRGDRVLIFGSFHTVGPALARLRAGGDALGGSRSRRV